MNLRGFGDRLTNEEDRTWMRNQLGKLLTEDYETKTEDILDTDRLIFGNFMIQGVDVKAYVEVEDFAKMKVKICDEETSGRSTSPARKGCAGCLRRAGTWPPRETPARRGRHCE